MVTKGFKLTKENGEYMITEISSNEQLKLPECIEELKGRYPGTTIDKFIDCVLVISLAGVTDSLRMVEPNAYERNSVLKKIVPNSALSDQCPLPDEICGDEYNSDTTFYEFEKYHTIKMGRDVPGNDNSIHAYIETTSGKLRCQFPNKDDIRLDSKRNNRKYWVDEYKIASGSSGGQFVRITSEIIEF